MSKPKDASLVLDDIIEQIDMLADAATRIDVDELRENRMLAYGVQYALLAVGEAAKRIPSEVRSRYPRVPWRDMIAQRDFLAHGYDVVDIDQIWRTVTEKLIPLRGEIAVARDAERGNAERQR